MKDNVSRSIEISQVIHDTRISNGQWPRRDVTCAVTKVVRNITQPKTYKCQKYIVLSREFSCLE
jgi:hypothetical protein